MKCVKWIIPVVFLFGSGLGCQVQKVAVDLYSPPPLELPVQLRSFLVTSRYVPAWGKYDEIQHGYYQKVDTLKWKLSRSVADTLYQLLKDDELYQVKYQKEPRMLRHNGSDLPEKLPWKGMQNVLNKVRTSGAIVLEGFDITMDAVQTDTAGDKFVARIPVQVTTAWRIYEPYRQRMPDETVYHWKVVLSSEGATKQQAVQALPDSVSALFQACGDAAHRYYQTFRPQSESAWRFYYKKGDPDLEKASREIAGNNWKKAESIWMKLAYHAKDVVVQAKASFNMALACERDGRINQALAFARRSYRLKSESRTMRYINQLNIKVMDHDDLIRKGEIIKKW